MPRGGGSPRSVGGSERRIGPPIGFKGDARISEGLRAAPGYLNIPRYRGGAGKASCGLGEICRRPSGPANLSAGAERSPLVPIPDHKRHWPRSRSRLPHSELPRRVARVSASSVLGPGWLAAGPTRNELTPNRPSASWSRSPFPHTRSPRAPARYARRPSRSKGTSGASFLGRG